MSRISSISGRHGELKLAFERRNGSTALAASFFRVPLQVMKPRYDASGCACVYLLSPTGGVVQGDDYQIEIALAANTHAILTTQAATKVYAMPKQRASQSMRVQVGQDAFFEYLPDPTILFRDANFSQSIALSLERGARVALQEIVMPGRLARGESLAFTRFASRVEASNTDGLFLFDACCIQPDRQSYLTKLAVLEGYTCWGSWYLIGDYELPEWEPFCAFAEPRLNQPSKSSGGMSRLHQSGVAIRMLAHNAGTIYSAFQAIWNWLKLEHFGFDSVDLRKY